MASSNPHDPSIQSIPHPELTYSSSSPTLTDAARIHTTTFSNATLTNESSTSALLPAHTQDGLKTQTLTPPPAYTSLGPSEPPNPWSYPIPSSSSSSSSSQTQHAPPSFPSNHNIYTPLPNPPLSSSHSQTFGPTPLSLAQPFGALPYAYYEPPGAADMRARRRFVSALACGAATYFLFMCAIGLEIVGEGGVRWYKA